MLRPRMNECMLLQLDPLALINADHVATAASSFDAVKQLLAVAIGQFSRHTAISIGGSYCEFPGALIE